ncbi:M3 family oligoendopeptidase [Pseudobutyrivibrio xylanivorans]|uniref:M3 family oligoendopeptidase n=1 Tax=Pseudobutyrivibrio xylanivorans TaxID=185007 RepID=A0A5P6VPC0_PSEXY|nr:M3 family oligoendopeptidase [Pseudobutyrivibrio xylanivorans]QFJ54300.1 M3 family oligoendopeptidase [Pseudobutyrivibrio xylanivorans]
MKFKDMPYERPSIDEYEKAIEELITRQKAAQSGEEQFEIHKDYYKIHNDFETAFNIAYIRHDADNTDEFYEKENNYFDEVLPRYTNAGIKYKNVLFESPYREYLVGKLGPATFKNMELDLKSISDDILPLMQEENALASRYDKLIATAKIEYEGETYNLSLMTPFTTNKDREVRKKAQKAVSDWFMSVTPEIDEIYDKMVKNRTEQAKLLGFDSYTDLAYCRMHRNSYGKADVENFRKQIKEYFVPFVGKLAEKRAARLGLDKLQATELGVYFNEGNPKPTGTPEEILKSGQDMYAELSAETKEFMNFMMEHELFDVFGRKNKAAGGYQTYLPNYKAPFIYANFNGTSGDVDVITHECGHAFQAYVVRNDDIIEHNDLGMETAEIHSMSMEYFTYGWMKNFFGDRYKDYLEMHIEDASTFLPYGTMVDEFQHIVYDNPEMTPAERKATWKKLEQQYRPYIDFSENEFFNLGGFWQKQLHIFDVPFYYIDYVLASICAMQFKVWMDEDFDAAWKHYIELCKLSGSDFYTNMIKEVGLKTPFENGVVKDIVDKFTKKIG